MNEFNMDDFNLDELDDISIEDLDKESAKHIKEYSALYALILALLGKQINNALNNIESQRLQREIEVELSKMNDKAKSYVKKVFPKYYLLSLRKVDAQALLVSNVSMITNAKGFYHKKALEKAMSDLYGDIAKNTAFMSEQSKKIIRYNTQQLLTSMIQSGESQKTIKRQLKEKLMAEGVSSFIDAGNKQWSIDKYVDMLVRTKSRIIHSEGTINRLQEYSNTYESVSDEFDLIQISSHNSTCWCGRFEGMVFSISGRSEKYPSIDTLPNQGYRIFHPNCKHVWLPYMPSLRSDGKVIDSKWLNKDVKELNKEHYHAHKSKA